MSVQCAACGVELVPDQEFCPRCGSRGRTIGLTDEAAVFQLPRTGPAWRAGPGEATQ